MSHGHFEALILRYNSQQTILIFFSFVDMGLYSFSSSVSREVHNPTI